ncbi:MAG TPA: hypothetical protein VGO40_24590 [Longimicrobium sp.]|jgi:uncharacterized membrane protein|nr:hypothetical protein [Longimicrobium sp.]
MGKNSAGPVERRKTPRLDLICSLILSVEWLGFGSLHFLGPKETAAEIPDFIPYKPAIVAVTGVAEVTTGILILVPKTRKAAAVASLALLGAFLPSIFKMLTQDKAMAGFEPLKGIVRVLLVPNHVLLGLAAVHLLRSDAAARVQPGRSLPCEHAGTNVDRRRTEGVLTVSPAESRCR